jgi:hypothetical protein
MDNCTFIDIKTIYLVAAEVTFYYYVTIIYGESVHMKLFDMLTTHQNKCKHNENVLEHVDKI